MKRYKLADGIHEAYIPTKGKIRMGQAVYGNFDHMTPYPLVEDGEMLTEPAPAPAPTPAPVEAAPADGPQLLTEVPESPKLPEIVEEPKAPAAPVLAEVEKQVKRKNAGKKRTKKTSSKE